ARDRPCPRLGRGRVHRQAVLGGPAGGPDPGLAAARPRRRGEPEAHGGRSDRRPRPPDGHARRLGAGAEPEGVRPPSLPGGAFLIPLAILVQSVVADRAMEAADVEARSLAPVVASVDEGAELDRIVGSAAENRTGELTVFMPDGRVLGHAAPDDSDVALARAGRSFTGRVAGGVAIFLPVVVAGTGNAVVRVMVPDARLQQGVVSAWAALAATGVAMVLLAVLVADRIASGVSGRP